jgi:hypothetical protein
MPLRGRPRTRAIAKQAVSVSPIDKLTENVQVREPAHDIHRVKTRVIGVSRWPLCLVAGQLVAEHARDHLMPFGRHKRCQVRDRSP